MNIFRNKKWTPIVLFLIYTAIIIKFAIPDSQQLVLLKSAGEDLNQYLFQEH